MYCNTVLLEVIEHFIIANKRYLLHLCTAILYSWRLLKILYKQTRDMYCIYRISSYNCRGNYSFLEFSNLAIFKYIVSSLIFPLCTVKIISDTHKFYLTVSNYLLGSQIRNRGNCRLLITQ